MRLLPPRLLLGMWLRRLLEGIVKFFSVSSPSSSSPYCCVFLREEAFWLMVLFVLFWDFCLGGWMFVSKWSSVLQPNSPQAMVQTALESANKTRLVRIIHTILLLTYSIEKSFDYFLSGIDLMCLCRYSPSSTFFFRHLDTWPLNISPPRRFSPWRKKKIATYVVWWHAMCSLRGDCSILSRELDRIISLWKISLGFFQLPMMRMKRLLFLIKIRMGMQVERKLRWLVRTWFFSCSSSDNSSFAFFFLAFEAVYMASPREVR